MRSSSTLYPALYTPRLARIYTEQEQQRHRAQQERRHPYRLAYRFLAYLLAGAFLAGCLGMLAERHRAAVATPAPLAEPGTFATTPHGTGGLMP